jgi:hypothetical protein
MQLYKNNLASSELMTIVGGFLGSVLFIFILTVSYFFFFVKIIYFTKKLIFKTTKAIGNLEKILFGAGFQTKLFPESNFSKLKLYSETIKV